MAHFARSEPDSPERPLGRPRLDGLEVELHKIPGVTGVRVIGDQAPSEIHIVATPGRPAKQVVRDVQSLAAAGFGMSIDHRIVSVVQLDEAPDILNLT